jgi:glycerol-3-phosphate acyltransferase
MVTVPSPRARRSVVAELEGGLLRGADTFPYFMLVAFEASGLLRFAALLALWPLLRLLELAGRGDLALRAAALVATAGVPRAEVEAVSRAVLPKFMADDVDPRAWAAFGSCEGRRVVVATRLPRVMVERFAREHLGAHEVVGCELEYSRLRRCTGLLRGGGEGEAVADRVHALFAGGDRPDLGIGRSEMARSFLPFCKVRHRSSSKVSHDNSSFLVNEFPCLFFSLGKTYASISNGNSNGVQQ